MQRSLLCGFGIAKRGYGLRGVVVETGPASQTGKLHRGSFLGENETTVTR